MSRTWVSGVGWAPAKVDRRCQTCRAVLPEQVGKGGRLRYCADHAPAMRTYMTAYQREHAETIRDRQRALYGYRPTVSATCADCGATFRTYTGAVLCDRCRQLARHRDEAPM